jgi:hypothetical protein
MRTREYGLENQYIECPLQEVDSLAHLGGTLLVAIGEYALHF